ncbi:hypothetical protein IJ00_17705 [Calothrix sp. 336/3]|nr:hypothetical protein IJ00_17705 [Calothrix sp. 336/3]
MPSISLDGFHPSGADEKFYLWYELEFTNFRNQQWVIGWGIRGNSVLQSFIIHYPLPITHYL